MTPADEDVERGSITALGMLVGGLVVYRLAETIADPDLWGHVVFGKQILATRRIVQPDLYSYITPACSGRITSGWSTLSSPRSSTRDEPRRHRDFPRRRRLYSP